MPELTGVDVLRRLDALVTDGHAVARRTFTVTALEGKSAVVNDGASQPYVIGENANGRGQAQRSVQYRDVGTTIKLLPRIVADGVVRVDLDLTDSNIKAGDAGEGQPSFGVLKLATTVGVPTGKAAVAHVKHAQVAAARQ